MEPSFISNLIENLRKSKKYNHISTPILEQAILEYLKKNNLTNKELSSKDERILIKAIKSQLHKVHGSFRNKDYDSETLLKRKNYSQILKNNASTKERINSYPEIYKKIMDIIITPKRIIDLGSGLNPLSIIYYPSNFNKSHLEYYSYDINEKEKEIINHFFKQEKINGSSQILDLSKLENLELLPKADLCLMFKFIDTIEANKKGHKYSEQIIKHLLENKVHAIVASFSTKTLTGKSMNHPYRGWIEQMLNRINLKFKVLNLSHECGEIFYVIWKD